VFAVARVTTPALAPPEPEAAVRQPALLGLALVESPRAVVPALAARERPAVEFRVVPAGAALEPAGLAVARPRLARVAVARAARRVARAAEAVAAAACRARARP